MHGNHLVWFMGPLSVCFAWGRHGLPGLLAATRRYRGA